MNLLPLLTLAACFASPSTLKSQFDSFVFDENGEIVFSLGNEGELTNIMVFARV